MELHQNFKDSVFNAINLDEIIWIDDRFSETSNTLTDEYLSEIQSLHENEMFDELSSFDSFEAINWGLPFNVIRDNFLPTSDDVITLFYEHMDKPIPDLSGNQFGELITLLQEAAPSVHHLSHKEWEIQKETVLDRSGTKLFLIDLNFEKEGLPQNHGEDIICELIGRGIQNCYLVLFTSETNFGKEEEEARKNVIAKLEEKTEHHHFSVLSKNIVEIDEDNISLEFKSAEFLKRVFLRKLSSEMLEAVSGTIATSIEALKSDLSQNSIYEVDTAIFNSSLSEGSSEFDLLYRLFSIKHKELASESLASMPELIDKLKSFRSVQMAKPTDEESKFIKSSMLTAPNFINLRNIEMFDKSVNVMHAPLCTGDIFEFNENNKFILIDQPCDLSVRGNTGVRKATEVLLIPFTEKSFKQNAKGKESYQKSINESKYHLIKVASENELPTFYRFDFSDAITVNSNLLDLAVFNSNGNLKFDVAQDDHELLFLPGWLKRFRIFKESVTDNDSSLKEGLPVSYSVFSLLHNDKFPVQINDSSIEIKGRRVKNLRSPFIEELMSAYFVDYKARMALEIDFS